MKSVYIINGSGSYRALFLALGYTVVPQLDESVSLVCFTGGEDVTPAFYGDNPHPFTHSWIGRDEYEKSLFHEIQKKGIPMVGICRGAQFLNVMSGGRMYQHVQEHGRSHPIVDMETGETIYVTSTHHQMMMPEGNYQLIAASALGGKREWFDGEVARWDISDRDNEVVFYPDTKCLCFQPHPEMYLEQHIFDGMRSYFNSLINKFLLENVHV